MNTSPSFPEVARTLAPAPVLQADQAEVWLPATSNWIREHRLARWTIPREFGGEESSPAEILSGMLELARKNLPATFVLSQLQAAVARLVKNQNAPLQQNWLPRLAAGEILATVGISHLTTSRQHDSQPALRLSVKSPHRGELNGVAPWVTAAVAAQLLVTGAHDEEGNIRMYAIPLDRPGITIHPSFELLALSETATARISFQQVSVSDNDEIAQQSQIAPTPSGGGAGSLSTSALALGHACGIIDALSHDLSHRQELQRICSTLGDEAEQLRNALIQTCETPDASRWTTESLRVATTSLALRAAQSYLAASRGSGFVTGHPAERLVRESLFFLVWSCPQEVALQLLDEFSRCDGTRNS